MAGAHVQLGVMPELGFVDKERAASQTETNPLGTIGNYKDIASLDARLTTIDATAYSAARLRQMTVNDKIFALRSADDSTGI
jgi:hypothetical protein